MQKIRKEQKERLEQGRFKRGAGQRYGAGNRGSERHEGGSRSFGHQDRYKSPNSRESLDRVFTGVVARRRPATTVT